MRKNVAAIVTEYRRHSHADLIVGKLLEGYLHDGRDMPSVQLVSLYVDQFPAGDLSLALAKKHGFAIGDTIEKTLNAGPIDGVLCIGEHGNYPKNERGQLLYPRRRFFAETARQFEKSKKIVPVFCDKHLAASWTDARWIYDTARDLGVPLMAGSSLPVTWRRPPLTLPIGCELESAVQIGYGPFEGYGFHALEALQCMVERRRGGETGVAAVTCLSEAEMWKALDRGDWSGQLLDAATALIPSHAKGDVRELTARDKEAGIFLIEYRDGLRAAVAMLNGWVYEGDGGAFCFAAKVKGQSKPAATHFYLQQPDPFAHFGYQIRAIERMVRTGHAAYPVERTLLTAGVLDAVMTSRAERGRRIATPHLDIAYKPVDWPFATDPVPKVAPR